MKIQTSTRIVWRYWKGNQNPYIEEEQKTQWEKEKEQKDNQRSTKHTHQTIDRVFKHEPQYKLRVNSGAPEW